MTGGTVVVLGPVGPNFAAGMTGGRAFVLDSDAQLDACLNDELVAAGQLDAAAAAELRALLDMHHRRTGSTRAAAILGSWPAHLARFRCVEPRADIAAATGADEGSDEAVEGA
jgi:glutamate synthase (NADPH/NADH) large chain